MKITNRLAHWGAGIVFSALIALSLASPSKAQSTLAQTTLAASLSETSNQLNLASATGVTTAVNGAPVTIAYVDTEAIGILTLVQGQTTIYSVLRGQYGTQVEAHGANAVVYIQNVSPQFGGFSGAGGLEVSNPPAQANCTTASQNVLPWINMVSGKQWQCQTAFTPAGNAISGTWIPESIDGAPNVNSPFTVYLTANYTNATTGATNVTGLSFYAQPNRNYTMSCHLLWQSSATADAPSYTFSGPSTPTGVATGLWSPVTASTFTTASGAAFATALSNAGTVTASTYFTDQLSLGLVNGANAGTVQVKLAGVATGTITVYKGSYCQVQ